MQAYIVRINPNSAFTDGAQGRPGRGTQTIVHAASEAEAKQRGAAALNVSPGLVTAVAYGGSTLGELAR